MTKKKALVSNEDFMESYRFKSDVVIFKKIVDIACEMLKKKQLYLLFGFTKDIDFEILVTASEFESQHENVKCSEFKEVLQDEVAVILMENIEDDKIDFSVDNELMEYLVKQGLDNDIASELSNARLEKRKYVSDQLIDPNRIRRYKFKESTLSKKLLTVNSEINKYVLNETDDLKYAVLEFSASNNLPSQTMPAQFAKMIVQGSESMQSVSFVCDKSDLDCLIEKLKLIASKL